MKPNFNINDLPKKHPFRAPENYFEELPNRVMQQTAYTQKTITRQSWQQQPLWRLAFASLVMLFIFTGVFKISNSPAEPASAAALLAQVNEQELVNYILASEQLELADLAEMETTESLQAIDFIEVTSEDLEYVDMLFEEEILM